MQKKCAQKKNRPGRPSLLVEPNHVALSIQQHVREALERRAQHEVRSTSDLIRSILLGESAPIKVALQTSRLSQVQTMLPRHLNDALRARAPYRKLTLLVLNILTGYEPPFKLDRAKIYL
jgi:hypothetical protein